VKISVVRVFKDAPACSPCPLLPAVIRDWWGFDVQRCDARADIPPMLGTGLRPAA